MNNLLQKTDFADVGTIIDSPITVEPTSPRNETQYLKYEDVIYPASDIEQQMSFSDTETIIYNNNDLDLSDTETVDYTSDIEFLQKRPLHPRERLRQNHNEIKFFKNVPQYLRDRLACKIKNRSNIQDVFNEYVNDDIKFIKKATQHPRDLLACKTKDSEQVEFIKKVPQHPRKRLRSKTKDKVDIFKIVPQHPRERLKRKTRNRSNIKNVFNEYEDARIAKENEIEFI